MCIQDTYDIKNAEAQRFLEEIEIKFVPMLAALQEGGKFDINKINFAQLKNSNKYAPMFKQLNLSVEKFTQDWNKNEKNRDK